MTDRGRSWPADESIDETLQGAEAVCGVIDILVNAMPVSAKRTIPQLQTTVQHTLDDEFWGR